MILNDAYIRFEASCSGDRRHICYMEPAPDSSTCGPPFYELQKCVKFFPEAGLVSFENAKLFCDVHGGKLAEVPQDVTTGSTYIAGIDH